MKMVKSLLLGTAAGFVALAGAQAADLPVKAKPVQYVKICSLYGAGFYYIPGTDMCLKVGGWVRYELGYGSNGSMAWGPFNGNANVRTTNNLVGRARGYITADARNQTEYGTLRSYIAVGLSENDVGTLTAANTFSANRAFIQWAGFTFGRTGSFYDFYSAPATAYWGAYPSSDTGDPGWLVGAYTAQFGNGVSGTISAEARRMTQIINQGNEGAGGFFQGGVSPGGFVVGGIGGLAAGNGNGTGDFTAGAIGGITVGVGDYGGFQVPDIVGNLRLDQAWGSAQVMAAYHQVNHAYYQQGFPGTSAFAAGHAGDEAGWVIGGGIKLLNPMWGAGDYFQAQVNYTEGAVRYVFMTPSTNWGKKDGDSSSFGVLSDAVVGGTTRRGDNSGLELTTAWGVNAAYEHFWNPQWRTSLYGGYAEVSYSGLANAMLCVGEGNGTGRGTGAVATAGCDNDWSTWWLGSRTQWNVTKDFHMGVDVMYSVHNSASLPGNLHFNGRGAPLNNSGRTSIGNINATPFVADMDNLAFRFRVHRDFYP